MINYRNIWLKCSKYLLFYIPDNEWSWINECLTQNVKLEYSTITRPKPPSIRLSRPSKIKLPSLIHIQVDMYFYRNDVYQHKSNEIQKCINSIFWYQVISDSFQLPYNIHVLRTIIPPIGVNFLKFKWFIIFVFPKTFVNSLNLPSLLNQLKMLYLRDQKLNFSPDI